MAFTKRYRFREEGPYDWAKEPGLPCLTTEDNPEVGRLLKSDGSILKVVRAKSAIPFGPQPRGKTHEEDEDRGY